MKQLNRVSFYQYAPLLQPRILHYYKVDFNRENISFLSSNVKVFIGQEILKISTGSFSSRSSWCLLLTKISKQISLSFVLQNAEIVSKILRLILFKLCPFHPKSTNTATSAIAPGITDVIPSCVFLNGEILSPPQLYLHQLIHRRQYFFIHQIKNLRMLVQRHNFPTSLQKKLSVGIAHTDHIKYLFKRWNGQFSRLKC